AAGGLRVAPLPRAAPGRDRRIARDPGRDRSIAPPLRDSGTPKRRCRRRASRAPGRAAGMTDDRSFEREARSWLEIGPTHAPVQALETALLLIQTTHQERDLRVPWRVRSMTTTARLVAAAIAIAIVVVGGAALILRPGRSASVGTPSASPASSVLG